MYDIVQYTFGERLPQTPASSSTPADCSTERRLLSAQQTKMNGLLSRINSLTDAQTALQKRLNEAPTTTAVQELQRATLEKEQRITQLQTLYATLQAQQQQWQRNKQALQQAVQNRDQNISQLRQSQGMNREELQKQFARNKNKWTTDLQALQDRYGSAATERNQLRAQMQQQQRDCGSNRNKVQSDLSELQRRFNAAQQNCASDKSTTQGSLASMKNQFNALQQKYASETLQYQQQMTDTQRTHETQLASRNGNMAGLRDRYNKLQSQYTNLSANKQAWTANKQAWNANRTGLQTRIGELERQIQNMRNRETVTASVIPPARNEQANLRREAMRSAIAAAVKQLNQIERKISPQDDISRDICARLKASLTPFRVNVDHLITHTEEFKNITDQITNLNEDILGAVRVYVRVKPLAPKEVSGGSALSDVSNKEIRLTCNNATQLYSQFYGVFGSESTNVSIYGSSAQPDVPQLHSVIDQLKAGYSVSIFAYGFSGSGKTLSLYGGGNADNKDGIVHLAISDLLRNKAQIAVHSVFEQYMHVNNSVFNPTQKPIQIPGKIIMLLGQTPKDIPAVYVEDDTQDFKQKYPVELSDVTSTQQLRNFSDALEAYRKTKGRIKKTMNNDQSSRSHLFIIFKVKMSAGVNGYLTVCDMAGRESPIDIHQAYYKDPNRTNPTQSMYTTLLSGTTAPFVASVPAADVPYYKSNLQTILKEGFYINETINHMTYYFKKKMDMDTKIDIMKSLGKDGELYQTNQFFIDPKQEENLRDTRTARSQSCLTMPIFKYINSLGTGTSDYRPSKFIMLCCIAEANAKCRDTRSTLQFSQEVSSSMPSTTDIYSKFERTNSTLQRLNNQIANNRTN